MGAREILSLQFGHYSNFVGTHWFNIQESSFEYDLSLGPSEIEHDILFREGLTPKGQVTFTPRLLLVDLKGSLKTLSETGSLYDTHTHNATEIDANWENDVDQVKSTEQPSKNHFQQALEDHQQAGGVLTSKYDLDNNVKVWSDFLYSRYHPRTVNIIKQYGHENKDSQFDLFPLGMNLWRTEQFQDEFSDRIRNYIEECDNFQGFHVTLDCFNAFGGLASACLEHLKDEYERKAILSFPVIPSYYSDYSYVTNEERHQSLIKDSIRVLNLALCFDSLTEHSSLVTPLSTGATGWRQPGPKRDFYHVSYDHKLPYHSSAILASALDTLTLKYRLKNTEFCLNDLCTEMSRYGRKISAASVCLPFSFNKGMDFIDCLDNWEGPLTRSITPSCDIGTDKLMQMFTIRGIPKNRLKQPTQLAGKQKDMPAYRCNTVEEMLNLYLSCNYFLCGNNVTAIEKGLSVKTPYPNIFDSFVGIDGNIMADKRPEHSVIETVPVLAGLHSGSGIGDMLENLHTEAKKIKFPRFHQFIGAGLETQDFTECLDRLFDLRECYEDNYNI